MLVVSVVSAVLALSSVGESAPNTEGLSRPSVHDIVERAGLQLADLKLESDVQPSAHPILKIGDSLRYANTHSLPPLDLGGALSSDTRQVLALLLGLFVGFGTGHLVARDRGGFILFLVVDIVIWALWGTFHVATRGFFWGIGGVAVLISHIIQGLDAYASAGGESFVQAVRENTVLIADKGRDAAAPPVALPTSRAFAFSF